MSMITEFADILSHSSIVALGMLWEFVVGSRAELFVFALAILVHLTLFGTAFRRSMFCQKTKMEVKCKSTMCKSSKSSGANVVVFEPRSYEECEQQLQTAYTSGEFRSVLSCWARMKRFDATPVVDLAIIVESMQRLKKETNYILGEVHGFLVRHPRRCQVDEINALLDASAVSLDTDLAEGLLGIMAELKLEANAQSYEALLSMHFATRDFSMVQQTLSKMKASNVPITTRARIILLKTALRTGNFEEAKLRFNEICASPSPLPVHIIMQIVDLACRVHCLSEVIPHLESMGSLDLPPETISSMLMEAMQQKDTSLFSSIEKLARSGPKASLNSRSYQVLLKAASSTKDTKRAHALFQEAVNVGIEITPELAAATLECCKTSRETTLAEALLRHAKPAQTQVVGLLIRFFCDIGMHSKACDVYEWWLSERSVSPDIAYMNPRLDSRTERSIVDAAIISGRESTVKFLVEASPADVAKHITMIQACSARKNLQSAFAIFEALQKNGCELTLSIYNTVLDACVECRDLQRAKKWMKQMSNAGKVDVVSYNTLIKAQVSADCFDDARMLMQEMVKNNMKPNHITYNELINGYIRVRNIRKVWKVVEEMQASGVTPNHVTCSILLKNLSQMSSKSDVIQTMDLIGKIEESMDEVLLSSVMEACVRVGQPELLASKLAQIQGSHMLEVNGAHTFGSLIKAYGHVGDTEGAWKCWRTMRSRHIHPGSITIGCMVECVASNGDPEGAYELILSLLEDEHCRMEVNAVMYGSVLKAFAKDKKMERVWTIYDDMQRHAIGPIVTTYNLLFDACACNGQMERIPTLLTDMKKRGVPPNLITFSTLLKGHCLRGDMHAAFETLSQMRRTTDLRPDEIMYNTLLDGCSSHGMIEEGKALLDQMQNEGIKPSNYTLSVLVKLMGNANQLDEVFDLVEKTTAKHGFKANAHVYANLVQACVINKKLSLALEVLKGMAKDKLQPDIRTYSTALRACINAGMYEQATALARAAMDLPGHDPYPKRNSDMAPKASRLHDSLVNDLIKALGNHGQDELATSLIVDIEKSKPQIRINAGTKKCVLRTHPWRNRS